MPNLYHYSDRWDPRAPAPFNDADKRLAWQFRGGVTVHRLAAGTLVICGNPLFGGELTQEGSAELWGRVSRVAEARYRGSSDVLGGPYLAVVPHKFGMAPIVYWHGNGREDHDEPQTYVATPKGLAWPDEWLG